ncbi:hypothetical protein CB1_001241020 [Camelus ferus]|nr:hypothetical protein CB1_001241020 [Camelus ferus]
MFQEEEPVGSTSEEESGSEDHQSLNSVIDVEDLGKIMDHVKKEKREKEQQEGETSAFRSTAKSDASERRAMISPALREALTKQGVPGVKEERFEEGMTVKHCALSLVGEPIMYPEINRFLKLLHECRISSFLVTNAQFPVEISHFPLSVLLASALPFLMLQPNLTDTENHDKSLKHYGFLLLVGFENLRFKHRGRLWLSSQQQRTVYRLTLVKAWNVDELQAYAELVSLGSPDFIEVKGVTYCGESSASSLTMANVPWHEEVARFVCELVELIPDYEIACEHEHSNCLLIAHKKFKIGREWWTWIDYNRFQELIQEYEDSGGSKTFSAKDYVARTPHWALFGANERGFDPKDTRYQRKNKSKDVSGC